MKIYKIKWKLKSPLATDLQSDTIFGHICWQIRYLYGEDKLTEFLKKLREGPYFTVSAGFPNYKEKERLPFFKVSEDSPKLENKERIPFPSVFTLKAAVKEDLMKKLSVLSKFDALDTNTFFKKAKKNIKYINLDEWFRFRNNFDINKFYNKLLNPLSDLLKNHPKEELSEILNELFIEHKSISVNSVKTKRNMVNRLTGTVMQDESGKGRLFDETIVFYEKDAVFTSYIKIKEELISESQLKEIFKSIELGGFGKKKSIGRGHFEIKIEELEDEEKSLFECEDHNAWLLLSSMIPSKDDSKNILYNGDVKFGKLGGSFADLNKPFKYPMYMVHPGSVVLSKKEPMGTLLQNVHPEKPEIVQLGYAFAVPFKTPEGGKD